MLSLGIIGLGDHAKRSHLPFFVKDPRVNVVTYFDPQVDQTEMPDVKKVETVEVLLEEKINAVFIASPDRFHPQQLLQCVQAGKHVFVEKPLALDDDGLVVVSKAFALAKDKGLLITSCHPRRFDPPVEKLAQEIPQWDVERFSFRFLYHKATDQWKINRSLMLDHLGHEVDLLTFLFPNDPIANIFKIVDSGHHYHVGGTLTSGVVFEFVGHRILEESKYYEWVDVVCAPNTIKTINLNSGVKFSNTEEEFQGPSKNYDVMFAKVVEDFVCSVLDGTPSYLSHDDMIHNTQIGIQLK
jgi:predicted dehydrogenase